MRWRIRGLGQDKGNTNRRIGEWETKDRIGEREKRRNGEKSFSHSPILRFPDSCFSYSPFPPLSRLFNYMGQPTLKSLFWRRFKKNRLAVIGGIIVFLLFAIAVLAPLIAPYDPSAIDVKHVLEPPSSKHPFGTDDLGRDILSRVIHGSWISLQVGFVAVGIATIIGIIFGALSGYYGGWVDRISMRFVDIMLAIPTFFLILAVIAFLEPSIWNIMIVIGVTSWMGVARLVRAEFLSLKEREFVLAARALGASDTHP